MQFDANCINCLVGREFRLAEEQGGGEAAFLFMKEVLQTFLDAPAGVGAPWLVPGFTAAYHRCFGPGDPYEQIRRDSNRSVLAMLPRLRARTEASPDPLLTALKYARTGNFLDFGILQKDEIERALGAGLEAAPDEPLDPEEYGRLLRDLEGARTMLIIGDNAGEIAFDLLLVEQLRARYPALRLLYAVRGENTQNDATRADAREVGMDRLVPIVDSGCGIPGTELACCGAALREAVQSADVILAKGQGNFETLIRCGYNVYYIFLCKCERLSRLLNKPLMTGMFLNERRIPPFSPYAW